MRDLTTIAAEELEARTALRQVSSAIATAEASLAGKWAEQHALLERVRKLSSEAMAAFERTLAIGQPESQKAAGEAARAARVGVDDYEAFTVLGPAWPTSGKSLADLPAGVLGATEGAEF